MNLKACFRRGGYAMGCTGATLLLACVGGPGTAAALCGPHRGPAGVEFDGFTAQKQAGPLAARRVWVYRDKGNGTCTLHNFFVFEFRGSKFQTWKGSIANNSCPLNVPGPFMAFGQEANGHNSFTKTRSGSLTFLGKRLNYHYTFRGVYHKNGIVEGFLRANLSLPSPTLSGDLATPALAEGPSVCTTSATSGSTIQWSAKVKNGGSPIFHNGGQGYAIRKYYYATHKGGGDPVCDQEICSISQA